VMFTRLTAPPTNNCRNIVVFSASAGDHTNFSDAMGQ
jgi:hypothetical protein